MVFVLEPDAQARALWAKAVQDAGLGWAGYAQEGQEGLLAVRRTQPSLLVVSADLNGPLDGIEALELILAETPLPVVFVYAEADADAVLPRLPWDNVFGVLEKPFRPGQALAALRLANARSKASALKLNEIAQHRATLDAQPRALWVLNAEGAVCASNQTATEMLGAATLVGTGIEDLLPLHSPEDRIPLRGWFATRRADAPVPLARGRALVLHTATGAELPVRATLLPAPSTGQWVLEVQDVSDRVRTDRLVAQVNNGLLGLIGAAYFDKLVQNLATVLEMDTVALVRFNQRGDTALTVAWVEDTEAQENTYFGVANTAWGPLAEDQALAVRTDARRRFPRDPFLVKRAYNCAIGVPLRGAHGVPIGALMGFRRLPLPRDPVPEEVFEVFGDRATAELVRLQAETALARKHREQQMVFESVPMLIMLKDTEGSLVYANRSLGLFYGLKRVGNRNHFPKRLLDKWQMEDTEVIRTRKPLLGRIDRFGTGPDARYYQKEKFPYIDENGRVTGILVVAQNITERRRNEKELERYRLHLEERVRQRTHELTALNQDLEQKIAELNRAHLQLEERQAQYRNLVESVHVAVGIMNREEKFSLVNHTCTQLLEQPEEILLQLPMSTLDGLLLRPDLTLIPLHETPMWRALHRGERVLGQVIGMRLPGRRIRWSLFNAEPQFDRDGTVDHVILSFSDITALKHTQAELEEARTGLQAANERLEAKVTERTQELSHANAALRSSEELYRSTVGVMEEGILIFGPGGELISSNTSARRVLAGGGRAAIPKHAQGLLPRFSRENGEAFTPDNFPLLEPFRTHRAVSGRLLAYTPPGKQDRKWLRVNALPVGREGGGTEITVTTFTDITERFLAEEALRRSHEMLAAVFQYSTDGLMIASRAQGIIRSSNARAAQLFNGPEDLVGHTLNALVSHAATSDQPNLDILHLLAHPRWAGEVLFTRPDGTEFWANVALTELGTEDPDLCYLRLTDISARKEAERQLLQLEAAINYARDAVIITGPLSSEGELMIEYTNGAFSQITGFEIGPARGLPLGRLIGDLSDREKFAMLKDAVRRQKASNFETITYRQDGTTFVADWSASPVKNDKGVIVNWIIILRDVTLRKRVEEEMARQRDAQQNAINKAMIDAQEAERARIAEDLHDGLGHNMSVLKMNFSTLYDKLLATDPAAAHLLGTSQELLDDTTQEVRNISRNLTPNLLYDFGLVSAIRNLCKRIEQGNQISIQFITNGEITRLNDEIEISVYRIVQELLNNTVKYAEAQEVTLQLTRYEDQLMLIYEDDGKGFDTHRPPGHASGMGLKNMDARARLIHATLSLDSRPGHGITAVLEVPLGG